MDTLSWDDGSPWEQTFWDSSQPDSGTEDGLQIKGANRLWHDVDVSATAKSVCKKRALDEGRIGAPLLRTAQSEVDLMLFERSQENGNDYGGSGDWNSTKTWRATGGTTD